MLVDDYQLIIDGLKKSFQWEAEGYPIVAQALNGRQALEQLQTIPIDIIFTDIRMPVMDGLELIKIVAEQYPQIKIAVLSAYDDFEQVRTAFKLGADDYLLKQEVDAEVIKNILDKFQGELLITKSKMELTKNKQLRNKITQEQEALATDFIENNNKSRDMFFKKLIQSERESGEDCLDFGIRLPYDRLALMTFTIETADVADNAELFFFSAEHKLCNELEQKFNCYLFNTNYNEYNLVFSFADDDMKTTGEEIFEFLQTNLS
ncbi:MAG: response regulator, partial [Oscillospiraceae bacterium]